MTITNTLRTAGPFVGNGITKDFPFSYKVFDRADVLVALTVTATDVETELTLDSDYTVTLNPNQNSTPGGVIHMNVAPPVGNTLAATSDIPIMQTLDLTNNGGFYPAAINSALDRIVISIQQLATRVGFGQLNVGMAAKLASVLAFIETMASTIGASLIGYILDATGAFASTLQRKARERKSLLDFIPPPEHAAIQAKTSTYDCRAAIQAAIDYSSANGIEIDAPEGQYMILSFAAPTGYSTVMPKSNTGLIGRGRGKTIFKIGNNMRVRSRGGIGFLYDHVNPLENITYRDFTVDWNGANNLNTQANLADLAGNVNRMGGSGGCWKITVDGCEFLNAAGHHFLVLSRTTAADKSGMCRITNNHFENCGTSIAGNQNFDHSSIYISAPYSIITGNSLRTENGNTDATAIEMVTGPYLCANNTIYGYNVSAICSLDYSSGRGWDITSNIFDSVNFGVEIWGNYGSGDITISDNLYTQRAGVSGRFVSTLNYTGTVSKSLRNVAIRGNTVVGNGAIATDSLAVFLTIGTNIQIQNNFFQNWASECVRFEPGFTQANITSVKINGNVFDTFGFSTTISASRKCAIFATGDNTNMLTQLNIDNNTFRASTPAGATVAAACIKLNADPTYIQISDNDYLDRSVLPLDVSTFTQMSTLTVNEYREGTWTPGDLSAGALAFTVATGTYTKNGRLCVATFDITFPTTANSASNKISLPFVSKTLTRNAYGGVVSVTDLGAVPNVSVFNAQAALTFTKSTGTSYTNAELSGKRLSGMAIFEAPF